MNKSIVAVGCIFLILVVAVISFADAGEGSIKGTWNTPAHGPMIGGQVLLFNAATGPPPSSGKYLRLPDAGTSIDSEGKFTVRVPAGEYYLVMRKRLDRNVAGPPREGDLQYYARHKDGNAIAYKITAGQAVDVGTVTSAEPFKKKNVVNMDGLTGIAGTVTDDQGLPVAGVRVFAYDSPNMQGKPLYASAETGADGKYFLNVMQNGTYYLKARTHYGGGKPIDGEFMGGYGKPGAAAAVAVETGKVKKDIDIQGTKFINRKPTP